ncbi:MAG: Imm42 family immunity protein [Neisseria sp.]|nr:Imm42 family immunity protein [Neisseria sp.]
MIFGDPYKFAIQIDFVEEWQNELIGEWKNHFADEGICNVIINGYYQPNLLPNQSVTILAFCDSLNYMYFYLNQQKIFANLFHLSAHELYSYMQMLSEKILDTSTELEENIFEFSKLSVPEISRTGLENWLFYSENQEKVICLDNNNSPSEIILEKGYCCTVIYKTLLWAKEHYAYDKAKRFSEILEPA